MELNPLQQMLTVSLFINQETTTLAKPWLPGTVICSPKHSSLTNLSSHHFILSLKPLHRMFLSTFMFLKFYYPVQSFSSLSQIDLVVNKLVCCFIFKFYLCPSCIMKTGMSQGYYCTMEYLFPLSKIILEQCSTGWSHFILQLLQTCVLQGSYLPDYFI